MITSWPQSFQFAANREKVVKGPASRLLTAACLVFASFLLSGCASLKPVGEPAMTLHESISRSQQVTLEALRSLDCKIIKTEECYLKGKFATGEIVQVCLRSTGPNESQIWVASHRTYVGMAWQQDRKNDVVWAIKKLTSLERKP